jgi:hypothetical protein
MTTHTVADDEERTFFGQHMLILGNEVRDIILVALAPTAYIGQSGCRKS